MFDAGRSGQHLYFSLVSAISGNIVISASGAISGRRSNDGSALTLLSGFIGEVSSGQGLYVANLFDFDISGRVHGFLFTASGCVPNSFTVITQNNVSGRLFAGSGLTYPASGANTVVPIASISGVNVVATASVASGSLYLASGSIFLNTFASGVVGGGSGNFPSAWGNSGAVVTAINLDKSGYTSAVLSGTVYPIVPIASISGTNAVVPLASLSGIQPISGTTVTVPIASISGAVGNSGQFVSVAIASISGTNVVVPPASLSGVSVTVPIASVSGINAVVPPASLSGTFVNVPIASISGVNALVNLASLSGVVVGSGVYTTVPPATLSGVFASVPPTTISGINAIVPPASLSGITVAASLLSGQSVSLYSGQTTSLPSGTATITIPDAILKRDYTAYSGFIASGMSGRCLLNATRKLINAWDLTSTSGVLTVFQEDDTAVAYRQAAASVSGAAPVTGLGGE